MKVGNLVRRKPNRITNQPGGALGLVTEIGPDPADLIIRVTLVDTTHEPRFHAEHWRNASHFEVVS